MSLRQSKSASSPSPNLPLGDINVVVLTDVHSWVGGHGRQEPELDADYGDVLSFYQHLKAYMDNDQDKDLWFVSNGDWAHGTGLAPQGASGSELLTILEKMPWDAVDCGNHELYESLKVETMLQPNGYIDTFGNRYLTANVLLRNERNNETGNDDALNFHENNEPLGNRYKVLRGKKNDLLVFGFLYNLRDPSDMVEIAKVEEVVRQEWFQNALKNESYDAVLVLAHMDLKDPLVYTILEAIRKVVGDDTLPVQFITGHTHYRGSKQLDDYAASVEAGRYLDTVGFVSFPSMKQKKENLSRIATMGDPKNENHNNDSEFRHVFLNANKKALANALNLDTTSDLTTPSGKELSESIVRVQQKLGLLEEIGCSPRDYRYSGSVDADDSLWKVFREQVAPLTIFEQENQQPSAMLLSIESWRYNLFSHSPLVVDDIWAVAPFNDTIIDLGSFSGSTILKLNATMNGHHNDQYAYSSLRYVLVGDVVDNDDDQFRLYTEEYGLKTMQHALEKIVGPDQRIEPNATAYTDTALWMSFVRNHWPCDGDDVAASNDTAAASSMDPLSSLFGCSETMSAKLCGVFLLALLLLTRTIVRRRNANRNS